MLFSRIAPCLFAVAFLAMTATSDAAELTRVKLLIVDGQNNHNWKVMTPLMNRGAEWAATGKVTIPVPENFPTEAAASLVPDAK